MPTDSNLLTTKNITGCSFAYFLMLADIVHTENINICQHNQNNVHFAIKHVKPYRR